MPLYEYLCRNCANRFERIVKFSDPPLKTCPQCQKDEIEQVISAPAVQFKGSGWYVTDYAKKHSSQGSSAPTRSDNGSDSSSSSKESNSGSGDSGGSSSSGSENSGSGNSQESAKSSSDNASNSGGSSESKSSKSSDSGSTSKSGDKK